jgi:predicted aspartyl protease
MTRHTLSLFLLLFTILGSIGSAVAEDSAISTKSQLAAADAFYKSGKLDDAAKLYESLLASDAKLVHARAGLMRVRLHQQRVDEAFELGKAGMALPSYTTELVSEMGNVQFRRAEMMEAEKSYLRALSVDDRDVRAHLGLARLYDAYTMHRMAYDHLKIAHTLAPADEEVQRAWFGVLPRRERLKAIEEYLSAPHPEDQELRVWLNQYAAYLKATADKPPHACRLVSKVEKTKTPLIMMMRDPTHVLGWGLQVKLNGHDSHLQLDTGASGILLGRKAAENAGLERISHISYGGVGDKGLQSGYVAVAKRIRIGELEFEDCEVQVSDRLSLLEQDGYIGADVFASYVVTIDGPGLKLGLAPLPKRPDDLSAATALRTDEDDAEQDENAKGQEESTKRTLSRIPKDRYVAPEMKDWTAVFRFGHELLIPTQVNDSSMMLFLIDTGASMTTISTAAARKVTRISREDQIEVRGVSGGVKDVYSADKVKLNFSHFSQQNQDLLTIDLSNVSRHTGTEISGLLGFAVLRRLEVKIDYRDGLVDFSYDKKRVPAFQR